ncbi:class I SAM-dependent methyltransferase [bacterium CPR1]|nr:class I SAM-dependent methyltransferase [bacterium CPR1]
MEGYYTELLAAFVRGKLGLAGEADLDGLMRQARAHELRTHKFKRSAALPRVRKVLGVLQQLRPASLLDFGTGRGVFLWPLLDELPELEVTCLDLRPDRIEDLQAVSRGGIQRLTALQADLARPLDFPGQSFDVVTALEVLEHMPDPLPAVREAVRLARQAVIVSVPSHADDNPEHLRLYTQDSLQELLYQGGAGKVRVEYVLNHMVAVARA